MRKIISICLVFTLCFLTVVPIYATSEIQLDSSIKELSYDSRIGEGVLQAKYEFDINNFKRIRFDAEMLTPISINSKGNIVYSAWFGDVENQIIVEEKNNGDIDFTFYEGDISTIIKLTLGNDLYANGEFVQHVQKTPITEKQTRARVGEWSTTPFYSDSSYVDNPVSFSRNKASWGVSTLAGMAVGAVVSIVLNAIVVEIAETVSGAVLTSIFSGFATSMITMCEVYGMEDAYYSFSFTRFESNATPPLEYSYKYVGACYSRRDLAGTVYPHTMYFNSYFF